MVRWVDIWSQAGGKARVGVYFVECDQVVVTWPLNNTVRACQCVNAWPCHPYKAQALPGTRPPHCWGDAEVAWQYW
jgi:hypothetical protein